MRKMIVPAVIGGALVLVPFLFSPPVRANLTLGALAGYYVPNLCGTTDTGGSNSNTAPARFEPGIMYGLVVGYDPNPHFRLRLEYDCFQSEPRDDYLEGSVSPLAQGYDSDSRLAIWSLILSGIYKFRLFGIPHFYAGIGGGPFSARYPSPHQHHLETPLVRSSLASSSGGDAAMCALAFAGAEYTGDKFFVGAEIRYIVVETYLQDRLTKADLGGLQVCLTVGLK